MACFVPYAASGISSPAPTPDPSSGTGIIYATIPHTGLVAAIEEFENDGAVTEYQDAKIMAKIARIYSAEYYTYEINDLEPVDYTEG